MALIQNVMVATDFNAASAHALRVAADLASRLGARLSVVHVVAPAPYPYPIPPPEGERAAARAQLEDLAESLGPDVVPVLRDGQPAVEIADAAAELGADLVVIGSHGRRGAARALLGSVAEKVVRLSPAPVLTVHPWRFEDRAWAGRALAEALRPIASAAPGIVAISRGAVIVAGEIGRSFEETPDLLLAAPVLHEDLVLGAVCEEGTVRHDPSEAARAVPRVQRDAALAAARGALREESTALRGSRWIGDVFERTIVVVTDVLDEPWSALAVCDVLRGLRAGRLIVAAPAASRAARAVVEREIGEMFVLDTLDEGADARSIYRDQRPISVHDAAARLRTRHSAA
jgi:nucleotide-binding universal stress UspA family protein